MPSHLAAASQRLPQHQEVLPCAAQQNTADWCCYVTPQATMYDMGQHRADQPHEAWVSLACMIAGMHCLHCYMQSVCNPMTQASHQHKHMQGSGEGLLACFEAVY
jgi:hypothetical protein